jgi:hypothetical protein
VLEVHAEIEVRIRVLLVWQIDREPDREAARLLGAAVRRLHHARAAAGDHGEAGLREQAADVLGEAVDVAPRLDPRRPEDGDTGPVDLVDRLEARAELFRDREDVPRQVPVVSLEDAPVLH